MPNFQQYMIYDKIICFCQINPKLMQKNLNVTNTLENLIPYSQNNAKKSAKLPNEKF